MGGREWTEDEEEFLKKNVRKGTKWLAKRLDRTSGAIYSKLNELGLHMRVWPQEDKQFLIDNINDYTYTQLARKLGRTKEAVREMARILGLRQIKENEHVTFRTLLKELGLEDSYSINYNKFIRLGFEFYTFEKIRCVDMDKFWVWAEQHQDSLNFKSLEHNALGKEPEWATKKIERDKSENAGYKCWTVKEIKKLEAIAKNGLDIKQMCRELRRSKESIMGQMNRQGIEYNPFKKRGTPWKQSDIDRMLEMRTSGESWEQIAEELDRTPKAVKIKYIRAKKG